MKKLHHKYRSTWIDIIFSVAIILLTISAFLLVFPTKGLLSKKEHPSSNANSPIQMEEIESNYPGVKIVTKTSNDPYSPFAIQYPQTNYTSFNDQILTYITEAQNQYIQMLESKRQKNAKTSGELNISFETITHHSGNYSFVLVTNMNFSDVEAGTLEIRSFHLNPENGNHYSIEDLLHNDPTKLEKIASFVRVAIKEDPSLAGHIQEKSMEMYTQPFWNNYRNYAISDEALLFYFDEQTIADQTVGPPIVTLPIDTVAPFLIDVFQPIKPVVPNEDYPSTETPTKDEDDSTQDQTTTHTENEHKVETSKKLVALTFDDGPDPKITRQILDTLKKYEARATFFMLGSRVEYYPDVVNEVIEAGHEIGNHTWNHADLTKLSADRVQKEIESTSEMIEKISGHKPEAFRPPYGAVNKTVRFQTELPVVLWDVDTLDWKHRNPDTLLQIIKEQTKDGSIILMHDIHEATADGLDAVLSYLETEGYEFVTVAELNQTTD